MSPKPLILAIVDGFGIAENNPANAIGLAKTPNIDTFVQEYTALAVQASSEAVGLPLGEMGNSETGHLNIGAGKIVYQDLPRINHAIFDKSFYKNTVLNVAIDTAEKNNGSVHIMGLVSSGGVHSFLDHLYAILDICKKKNAKKVWIHAFLDGRDTPFNSGKEFVRQLSDYIKGSGVGSIASITGRFYAMDRDNHWERIEKVYRAITEGASEYRFGDPIEAIESWYAKKIYDEEIEPTVIEKDGAPIATIQSGDSVLFFNFRPDRARELTHAFVSADFSGFERVKLENIYFVTMAEYEASQPVFVAFPPEEVECPLPCQLAQAGLWQLHIAETEKYAHVTYFLNGGKEGKTENEDDILIPSPRIASYAEKPEMSAYEITARIEEELAKGLYDVVIVNYANPDMVGHTGDLKATIKAVEVVDECLGRLYQLIQPDGCLIITADHGNAEIMFDVQTGHINKQHTALPVPVLIIGEQFKNHDQNRELYQLIPSGVLADVTPTVLKILHIPQPKEMKGTSLV
ncbi:MAG: phosphoglycerate mutase (2,3-diphosphoglycerate-independent) [Candidatus Jacksonbacteria bacterium RIFCSPLOWO2_02_FULL_43_9]|nr:MAG: phosphoglycerate mutase (2,3-diphosphoglycerate-independent) [Candidatus Jacksonbacteria bacterium RIFCSPHIGHO2_02_FULL_43_10]OGY70310.1 MAG: phosphoglycerate mutase (2,3-diphosphoglycerate-independent) [Candidatus Jacksonbacteria bacterium RIFCSPLOWO2_01_FULL_44_13]OGY72761.1 MAG: phosphoglycerate mutase (2,3-diphosphoglycerate-independent) [Candidatus Jacksonbacteria bacterium RIFCSPLOWO2_02_FULL_43_9]HAZ16947.1 2,3-bisphosphoglycerate-independent phosphoglycerate mutase [Candidatus Ja